MIWRNPFRGTKEGNESSGGAARTVDPDSLFASDRPEESLDRDLLGRRTFAARVAETIGKRAGQDGLVIGLYGPWGDGKTTLLKMVESELKRISAAEVIWFNPWYFKEQDDLVLGFLTRLALAMEVRLGKAADDLKRVLNKYGTLLSFLPTSVAGMDFGKPMTEASNRMKGSTLEDLKRQLEVGLAKVDVDLVVFVDDLDRLERKEIHYVLKLVKLVADFRRVTYVLAFDDEMVSAAIAEQYGRDKDAGRNFLEKIVQVPLRLPRPEPKSVRDLALREVDRALTVSGTDLSQEEANEFRRYFDPLFAARSRTLREAKRFGNSLVFALPLLKGEVRAGDLLLLEALRALAPDVYKRLAESRPLLVTQPRGDATAAAARKKEWNDLLDLAGSPQRHAVEDLLEHLFPRVRGINQNYQFGGEWDTSWAAEQRAASADYFDRYFLYAVSRDDVPDASVRQLFAILETGDVNASITAFGMLVNDSNADQVIKKLRVHEDRVSLQAARTLIAVLIVRGHALPNPRMFFSFGTARAQAIILSFKLLKRLPIEERGQIVLLAVVEAPDVGLAAELFRRVRYSDEEREKGLPRVVTEDDEKLAERSLIERIEREWRDTPFYLSHPGDSGLLFHLWNRFGNEGAERQAVGTRISQNPREAVAFMSILLGQSWSAETGLPLRPDMDRSQYDSVARLVDPGVVVRALEDSYGPEVSASTNSEHMPDTTADTPEVALAKQFFWLHRRATKPPDLDSGVDAP